MRNVSLILTLSFAMLSVCSLSSCKEKDEPEVGSPSVVVNPDPTPEPPADVCIIDGYYRDPSIDSSNGALLYEIRDSYFCEHIVKGYYHYIYPNPMRFDEERGIMACYDVHLEKYYVYGIKPQGWGLSVVLPYRQVESDVREFSDEFLQQILSDYSISDFSWNSDSRIMRECGKETFQDYDSEYSSLSVNPMAALLIGKWNLCDYDSDILIDMEFKDYYAYSDVDFDHRADVRKGIFSVSGLTLTVPENSMIAKYYGNEFIVKFDFVDNTVLGRPRSVSLITSSGKMLNLEWISDY